MPGIRSQHLFLLLGACSLTLAVGCGSRIAPPATTAIVADEAPAAPATKGPGTPAGAKPAATTAETSESKPIPRETLFKDWPKPKVAIVITGDQYGYIEPCGCAGLANQKGGLARRYTLFADLRAKGWPLVALDLGNQVRRFGRQSEIKFQVTAEGLKKMGYQAIGFGPDDLRLSFGELLTAVVAADEKNPTPFLSANVSFGGDLTPRFRVLTAGGKKIGVTAVLGPTFQKKVSSTDIVVQAADEALKKIEPELVAAKCDLYVLLSHSTEAESKELAAKHPLFNVVVTAGISGEPTREPEKLNQGKTLLVQTGNKGMFAAVIGLYDDAKPSLRYQRVPLDSRFADAPPMLELLKTYQEQLENIGLAGLELEPKPHPSGGKFVGSAACADCHTKAYDVWKATPHAHATESLVHPPERKDISRHFDPECLACHVTGWNAPDFHPYLSGYLDLKKTPKLLGNGCENCHGPGDAHIAAEGGDTATKAERERLRTQLRVPKDKIEHSCIECHDHDNSPDFHAPGAFEKYWKRVEHKGKD